jgi:anti-sigma regulatory factor (Ser/Thr protein kinase)
MTMQEQYQHQAVPYQGQDEFLSCCAALVDDASAREERLLFLVSAAKTDALRGTFGAGSEDVTYIDMDEHGRNPARLMTMLDGFRFRAGGRRCVSINEPTVPGRSAAGVWETRFAESVLNSPALQSWPMSVRCLYDSAEMDDSAVADMRRTHPLVHGEDENPSYEAALADTLFAEALPAAPDGAVGYDVRDTNLGPTREFVRSFAAELSPARREDLVLAANEIVTNSLQHGGGECRISMWGEPTSVICEVRDAGHITDPMVGRLAAAHDASAGRGLWLANHLCDLVQIRSSQAGTTVRLHVDR